MLPPQWWQAQPAVTVHPQGSLDGSSRLQHRRAGHCQHKARAAGDLDGA